MADDAGARAFVFIVGTAKAGTTSLARWLGQHDDIALSVRKEPRFHGDFAKTVWQGPTSERFNETIVRSLDDYLALYADRPQATWCLDGSTDYLWNDRALEDLIAFRRTRRCKFVCIVRDPVDRAISEYSMTLRMQAETVSLTRSLDLEPRRIEENWPPVFHHLRRSLIRDDLHAYSEAFGTDLMILSSSKLADPQTVTDKVCAFLDLPAVALHRAENENASPRTRSPAMEALRRNKRLSRLAYRYVPPPMRKAAKDVASRVLPARALVTPSDIAALRERLQHEISACIADPLVPTDHWTLALDRP